MEATTLCVNAEGHKKATYASEEAARRALKHSPRWRRRGTWPVPYLCPECRGFHLAHGKGEK